MNFLTGPRMYYSLFGPIGVLLGAKARVLGRSIELAVEIAGIRHQVHLRVRKADVWLCRQILLGAQYDATLTFPPRVIVDAGANIGLASIFYANRYPEAKIIAIEPEPSNYEMLTKNVALYPNVLPMKAALWNSKANLYSSPVLTAHHAYQVRDRCAPDDEKLCATIPGLTVRDLMAKFAIDKIDLLKVDIEGSEKEVFQDARDWIQQVGVIAIEIHEFIRTGCIESVYNATANFELRWQSGETTYFAREGTVPNHQISPSLRVVSCDVVRPSTTSRFPMKIVQVI